MSRHDDLVARYQAGDPVDLIAADLGINRATVFRRLAAAGVAADRNHVGTGRRDWSQTMTRRWLTTQIRKHRTLSEIATELGCDPTTVSRRLASHGLRAAGQRPTIDERTLRGWERRYTAGETLAAIAGADHDPRTVRTLLAARGVQMRPPGRRPQ